MVDVYGKATAGVYAEIIHQIYDSIDKRIREAVSNAYDAHATEVKVSIYKQRVEPDKIVISDNGHGMTPKDICDKYVCMGGGDNYNNKETIGRIGIGALSVFALGDTIVVNTRKIGTEKVVTAHLRLSAVKSAEDHAIPIDGIKLGNIIERDANETDPKHFTEINITDLSLNARTLFTDARRTQALIESLERILPIPYRSDDQLFKHMFTDLRDCIQKNKYVIEVIFHVPHLEITNMKLRRRTIYSVERAQIEEVIPIYPFKSFDGANDPDMCVYGYLYINKDEGLHKDWQGINTRIKNVTIERNTFFRVETDSAARVRIGGELFIDHIDENNAIQSNRSGFAIENNDYRLVAGYMDDYILKAIAKVRKSSELDSLVKKVVKQIGKIRDLCDHISEIEDKKEGANYFQEMTDNNIDIDIDEIRRFSLEAKLIKELEDKFNIEPEIIWSPVLSSDYYIVREDDDFYTIQIHENLRKFLFDVAGNSIEYVLSHCGTDNPFAIKKERNIFINIDSPTLAIRDITKLDVGFLEVALILYLNYLCCNGNADELYRKAVLDLSQ